jgi:ABC-type multidrug transport system fused ATPase/permease subunit
MIIEEGTHDKLMDKHGRYKEVFDIQSQYYNDSDEEKAV